MKTIGAALFKEQCLSILDHLEPEGIVVTKRGKPIARVSPISAPPASWIGALAGRIEIHGDITTTGLQWEVDDQP
jgi:antitoxin (DNA-binding transcriptional repressor) of toxin-antitoxin stability system